MAHKPMAPNTVAVVVAVAVAATAFATEPAAVADVATAQPFVDRTLEGVLLIAVVARALLMVSVQNSFVAVHMVVAECNFEGVPRCNVSDLVVLLDLC